MKNCRNGPLRTAPSTDSRNPNALCRALRRLHRKSRRFLPRRLQAYCIGAAKTGTTSIAEMFRKAYRAEHEPEARRTNRLVIDYLQGYIDEEALRVRLLQRDWRLHLELEAAHPLGYVGGVLADLFPHSLFIVTIREPYAWLRSRLNFHVKVDPPAWREYRDYFWTRRHKGYAPQEAPLERYGLCSLDTYLEQYADHYRRVLAEIPCARRIVIRTSRIDHRLSGIARFLGVDRGRLDKAHAKHSDRQIDPLSEMDSGFVEDRIASHCGSLIREFFRDSGVRPPSSGPLRG